MSMNPSFSPERTEAEAEPFLAYSAAGEDHVPGIRKQAIAIIKIVMSSTAPEGADAREQLRACIEARPGRPEVALAEHLLALRPRAAGHRVAACHGTVRSAHL